MQHTVASMVGPRERQETKGCLNGALGGPQSGQSEAVMVAEPLGWQSVPPPLEAA